jgi:hypothetical protein
LNNPLSIKGFEDNVCHFFKGEPFWLKHLYMKKGQQTCSMGMELDQWLKLMAYWIDENTIVKVRSMCDA